MNSDIVDILMLHSLTAAAAAAAAGNLLSVLSIGRNWRVKNNPPHPK